MHISAAAAAGEKLSSAAALRQISENLAQTHETSTAVLTTTDPDLLNYGSSAVARTPSYCREPMVEEV